MFNVQMLVILNIARQTSTIFKYGTSSEIQFLHLRMAVDSYIPEPEGIMVVNSINAVASPPQPIQYYRDRKYRTPLTLKK
jgi:hypothetical protein